MNRDEQIWQAVRDLERAAWARKWGTVKQARKALERLIGPRPSFGLFDEETRPQAAPVRSVARLYGDWTAAA